MSDTFVPAENVVAMRFDPDMENMEEFIVFVGGTYGYKKGSLMEPVVNVKTNSGQVISFELGQYATTTDGEVTQWNAEDFKASFLG